MTNSTFKPVAEQLAYLKKGVAEIIPEAELKAKLDNSVKTGKPLRVYLGVDPTAPDLHLGHTVVLRKLKHFQDLGHTAIFLIGDFSAMIGDPTGQSETRPPLTREQVGANAKTYLEQVFKILDRDKTEVRYNSEWLAKLTSYEIIRLTAKYPLARMLEREDFRARLAGGWKGQLFQPSEETLRSREGDEPAPTLPSSGKASLAKRPSSMAIHELLYPLLTALDAVELKSDVELGATEQKFNLLIHREIQREYGLPGQAVLTMPILVGLDGQRKMSKSLGNYIGITEPPQEMFGKMMSIPDELMWSYYELVTDRTPQEIAALKQEVTGGKLHPMDAKMRLAQEVVTGFHGADAARKAAENFQHVFRDRQAPEEVSVIRLIREKTHLVHSHGIIGTLSPKWCQLLKYVGQSESVAEAARLIEQGGLEANGAVLSDPAARFDGSIAASYELRLGKKKFLRIVVE